MQNPGVHLNLFPAVSRKEPALARQKTGFSSDREFRGIIDDQSGESRRRRRARASKCLAPTSPPIQSDASKKPIEGVSKSPHRKPIGQACWREKQTHHQGTNRSVTKQRRLHKRRPTTPPPDPPAPDYSSSPTRHRLSVRSVIQSGRSPATPASFHLAGHLTAVR